MSEPDDNLPLAARTLHEQHPQVFQIILDTMAKRVPGISSVEPLLLDDGFLTLRFKDGSFKTPFLDRHVSDGTVKMFAYLVLLFDPRPHPLLCVEEPENQLDPHLMAELAEEFRSHTRHGGKVFVSTHSQIFSTSPSWMRRSGWSSAAVTPRCGVHATIHRSPRTWPMAINWVTPRSAELHETCLEFLISAQVLSRRRPRDGDFQTWRARFGA